MTKRKTKTSKSNAALIKRARTILKNIEFFNYRFFVLQGHGGVYLKAVYEDADIYTKIPEDQHTRKWLLSPLATDSEIVQTAFKCCLTSFEHRTREGFKYKNARVFGPHFNIEDLVGICHDGREAAGGRG